MIQKNEIEPRDTIRFNQYPTIPDLDTAIGGV